MNKPTQVAFAVAALGFIAELVGIARANDVLVNSGGMTTVASGIAVFFTAHRK